MAILYGTPSFYREMMEKMGFVFDSSNDRYYFGDDSHPNVYVIVGDNNTMQVVCSREWTTGTLSAEGFSGNPLKIEYFPLKNGGVVFRAKYVSNQSDAIGYPFCFCAFKNGDGNYEYVCRAYISDIDSEYHIYHDNNNGRVTMLRPVGGSSMADDTANVIEIGSIYNQFDAFLPPDVMWVQICPKTLSGKKSYGVTIDNDTYVMGMSDSDNENIGVGNRLCFRISDTQPET